jgi:hypothetical protein
VARRNGQPIKSRRREEKRREEKRREEKRREEKRREEKRSVGDREKQYNLEGGDTVLL